MSGKYKLSLGPVAPAQAPEEVCSALENSRRALGFLPHMYARMANSPGVLKAYLDGYAAFRASGQFTPIEQEVVFLAISQFNGCRYCIAAHSMIANMAKMPREEIDALRQGKALCDPKLAALADFVREMTHTRGLPDREPAEKFLLAGYTERHMLEILLAMSVKTLSNYANHLFDTPCDDVFAEWA